MADIKTPLNDQVSSTTMSKDDEDTVESTSKGMIRYNAYYTTSRTNMTLHIGPPSTPATYYMESDCSLKGLMILLRRGDAKTSPIVAFARLPWTSRHLQLGTGDYHNIDADQITWVELHRDRSVLVRSDYHFSTSEGDDLGKRAEFDWRKDKEKPAMTVFDCTDKYERVVAKMASGGGFNWNKGAEIEVLEEMREGLSELLIVGALAIWTVEGLNYRSLRQGYSNENKR